MASGASGVRSRNETFWAADRRWPPLTPAAP